MYLNDLNNLTPDERFKVLQRELPKLSDKTLSDLMTLTSYELQDRKLAKQTAEDRKIWR